MKREWRQVPPRQLKLTAEAGVNQKQCLRLQAHAEARVGQNEVAGWPHGFVAVSSGWCAKGILRRVRRPGDEPTALRMLRHVREEELGAPDRPVDSVSAIRSFLWTPPKTIPPIRPLQIGRASSQRVLRVAVASANARCALAGRAARAKPPHRKSCLVGLIEASSHSGLDYLLCQDSNA